MIGPSPTLGKVEEYAKEARESGGSDPELSHSYVDDIVESAVIMSVEKIDGWAEALTIAYNILQEERENQWGRWHS